VSSEKHRAESRRWYHKHKNDPEYQARAKARRESFKAKHGRYDACTKTKEAPRLGKLAGWGYGKPIIRQAGASFASNHC